MTPEEKKEVEQIIKLGHEFSDKAASIAAEAFLSSYNAVANGAPEPSVIDNFKATYSRACFDAYTTGAIEALRVVNKSDEVQIPWMGEQDTPAVAREMLQVEVAYNHA